MFRLSLLRCVSCAIALLLPGVALAHPGHASGFIGGLVHPLTGIDHLLAMAAVGWWAASAPIRRWWAVPLTFATCTLGGALLGRSGALALPGCEAMIALSLIVFGGLLVTRQALTLGMACALAGLLALFHGQAHGAEMPRTAAGSAWLAGMVLATAALHVGGALAGRLATRHARWLTRAVGAGTALTGLALLSGVAG